MPRRQISSGLSPSMRLPAKMIEPWSGGSTPAMMLNKVVLPAPFGPMTAKIAPCATLKAYIVDREQAAKALADPIDVEERGHDRVPPVRPSMRASHGHTPSGSTITTTSRHRP